MQRINRMIAMALSKKESYMKLASSFIIIGLVLAVMLAGDAHGTDPDVKCQAAKLKAAGKYAACRLKEESKAASRGTPVDYTKCEQKFADKWTKAESRAVKSGSACPSEGDFDYIHDSLALCSTNVEQIVGGGPDGSRCCAVAAGWCVWSDLASCEQVEGTPGNIDSSCNGATGECSRGTPQPGPCCDWGSFCISGPIITEQNCLDQGSTSFFGSAICTVDGDCL
jgi:hypothetical protein